MDQFDAMIAGAPTDQEHQQALAQALRRQNILGQMASVTGGDFAPIGKELQQSAQTSAEHIAAERDRQNALQQQQLYHQQEMDQQNRFHQDTVQHQNSELSQQRAIANMTDARDRAATASNDALRRDLMAERGQQQQELEAQKAADRAEAQAHGGKPIPDGEFQKLSSFRDALDSVTQAKNSFQPQFSGSGMLTSRPLENAIASNLPGLASQNMKDANNWWQMYGRGFTLDEMHNKFGARISPTEQAMFEKVHINPNMDGKQIAQNLDQIGTLSARKLAERLNSLEAAGFNKDQINEFRKSLPGDPQGQPGSPPQPGDKWIEQAKQIRQGSGQPAPAASSQPVAPQQASPQPQQPTNFPLTNGNLPYVPATSMLQGIGQ
jgi:hypothetical protein